jgi:hypothetical protein
MPERKRKDIDFEKLAASVELEKPGAVRAPGRLKAKVYSALMLAEAAQGPLRDMAETRKAGGELCAFEELVRMAPVSRKLKSSNICRICHARVLAEMLEQPPIYWPHCPYVKFKKT